MKKNDNDILIEKLSDYERRCDSLLETLQSIAIFNMNFDTPQEAVIDVNSTEWQMLFNDLLAMTKKYPTDSEYDFKRFIIMFDKATKYPNTQNISDLKVSIYSLKNHLKDTFNDYTAEVGIWAFVHPKIRIVSMKRFEDGYYADAVECAFKEVKVQFTRDYTG